MQVFGQNVVPLIPGPFFVSPWFFCSPSDGAAAEIDPQKKEQSIKPTVIGYPLVI